MKAPGIGDGLYRGSNNFLWLFKNGKFTPPLEQITHAQLDYYSYDDYYGSDVIYHPNQKKPKYLIAPADDKVFVKDIYQKDTDEEVIESINSYEVTLTTISGENEPDLFKKAGDEIYYFRFEDFFYAYDSSYRFELFETKYDCYDWFWAEEGMYGASVSPTSYTLINGYLSINLYYYHNKTRPLVSYRSESFPGTATSSGASYDFGTINIYTGVVEITNPDYYPMYETDYVMVVGIYATKATPRTTSDVESRLPEKDSRISKVFSTDTSTLEVKEGTIGELVFDTTSDGLPSLWCKSYGQSTEDYYKLEEGYNTDVGNIFAYKATERRTVEVQEREVALEFVHFLRTPSSGLGLGNKLYIGVETTVTIEIDDYSITDEQLEQMNTFNNPDIRFDGVVYSTESVVREFFRNNLFFTSKNKAVVVWYWFDDDGDKTYIWEEGEMFTLAGYEHFVDDDYVVVAAFESSYASYSVFDCSKKEVTVIIIDIDSENDIWAEEVVMDDKYIYIIEVADYGGVVIKKSDMSYNFIYDSFMVENNTGDLLGGHKGSIVARNGIISFDSEGTATFKAFSEPADEDIAIQWGGQYFYGNY